MNVLDRLWRKAGGRGMNGEPGGQCEWSSEGLMWKRGDDVVVVGSAAHVFV